MVRRLIVLLCVAAAAPIMCAQPPAVTLGDVLRRAGAYVVDFERDAPGVVAEERYVQEVHYALQSYGIGDLPLAETVPATRRLLFSDLLLVRPLGGTRWIQFRDVFSVDGTPVHDRNERHAPPRPRCVSATKYGATAARSMAPRRIASSGGSRCWWTNNSRR